MPKRNVFQLLELRVSSGEWEFAVEGFCWKNTFSKWGGSSPSPPFLKKQFTFPLEVFTLSVK